MDWLPASIFSVVVGAIAFFIKRSYTTFEKAMSQQREDAASQFMQLREDSETKMGQLRADFQSENAAIRADFRASMDSQGKRIEKLETAVSDMPYKYTLKEDFIRSMNSVDKKLDAILDTMKKGGYT